jgi:hypothetical protein
MNVIRQTCRVVICQQITIYATATKGINSTEYFAIKSQHFK